MSRRIDQTIRHDGCLFVANYRSAGEALENTLDPTTRSPLLHYKIEPFSVQKVEDALGWIRGQGFSLWRIEWMGTNPHNTEISL